MLSWFRSIKAKKDPFHKDTYKWKKRFSAREIVSFTIRSDSRSFCLENFTTLTFRNVPLSFDPRAMQSRPAGYFDKIVITSFNQQQAHQLFDLICKIPFHTWQTGESELRTLGVPGGCPQYYFGCKFSNGKEFQYLPSWYPPKSFLELHQFLEDIKGPDPAAWHPQPAPTVARKRILTSICVSCMTKNRETANVCRKCGVPFAENQVIKSNEAFSFDETAYSCSSCHEWNACGDKYCSSCGKLLLP